MKFQIKNRWTGDVQFECELSAEIAGKSYALQLGFAVKAAHNAGAVLRSADLSGAVLRGADLSGADLSGADLSGAVLRSAVLRSADLRSADLRSAVLRSAVLSGAVLSGAVLRSAVLSGAVLRGADLSGAVLTPIRDDLWAVLSAAPREVAGLRAAIAEGRIDGSTYHGECACLVGTIANVRGVEHDELGASLCPNATRPIEAFFTSISKGDTPATNQAATLALQWVDEWLATMRDAARAGAFEAPADAQQVVP